MRLGDIIDYNYLRYLRAQRHGGGRRAGRAAGGGGGDHGAASDGTHRLHLPQLGTHWTLEALELCICYVQDLG